MVFGVCVLCVMCVLCVFCVWRMSGVCFPPHGLSLLYFISFFFFHFCIWGALEFERNRDWDRVWDWDIFLVFVDTIAGWFIGGVLQRPNLDLPYTLLN